MTTPFGDFGPPPDAVAWTALAVACVLALGVSSEPLRSTLDRVSDRAFVAVLAALAAALSFGYVVVYLRGGPRIIDATAYLHQAKALASGHVAVEVPVPSASFRGRFLLASPDGSTLSGIFPPGYPAVLALGVLVGAPLAVGPAIGAGLVVATHRLALASLGDRGVARLAAALSVSCAVLRYHTADTMSHGWAALLFAVTVLAARAPAAGSSLLSGASAGWLVATRPVTGALALVVAFALCPTPRRRAAALVAAAVPILLFAVEQRIATGAWLRSTQLAYYAVSDGPPGCFRYGFGAGIGCTFEHGDFVRAHLEHGYGLVAALGTTLRRLKMHLPDAANAELFFPVLAYALVRAPRALRPCVASVLGVMVLHAPFYFDGNYPGGGARFFADALPFEHVLVAWALSRFSLARFAIPVALAGFAFHTSYDHLRLAHREGGRPMFEASVLRARGVERGLVFVDTDHGFLLGHDPGVRSADPRAAVVVARRRDDAHDLVLFQRLGRPPAFAYEYSPADAHGSPRLVPWVPAPGSSLRYEAEAEWPPLVVEGASVEPVFPPCASRHRALAIRPAPAGGRATRVRLELVPPESGSYRLVIGWVGPTAGRVEATFRSPVPFGAGRTLEPGECGTTEGPELQLSERQFMEMSCSSEQLIDFMELVPVPR